METAKVAACGIDCTACGQYKVTMQRDVEAAESLVPWFKSQGWIGEAEDAEAVMNKAPLCKGCWDRTGDCFWNCGCGSRDFYICCQEKQIHHCGECSEFPCENYSEWAGWHESHQKAMAYLLSLRADV